MLHESLSGEIIGAAMTVLNTLKPGLDEKLYEKALCIELSGFSARNIRVTILTMAQMVKLIVSMILFSKGILFF